MKVYTYDYVDQACVIERECDVFGWPNRDNSGATMYENTHFHTPREAWDALVCNLEAAVSLDAGEREQARKNYEKATVQLADSAERLARARRAGPPHDEAMGCDCNEVPSRHLDDDGHLPRCEAKR